MRSLQDLGQQAFRDRIGVARLGAQQHQQPRVDGADGSTIDLDAGFSDALKKGFHGMGERADEGFYMCPELGRTGSRGQRLWCTAAPQSNV